MLTTGQAVEGFWNAYNAHDLEALLSLVDEGVVVRFPLSDEPIAGKSDVSAIWSLIFYQLVPDIHQEIVTAVVDDQSAAFELIESGTLRLPSVGSPPDISGPRKYEHRVAVFLSVNGSGYIDRIDFYWDTDAFARKLGLNAEALKDFRAHAVGLGQWVGRATSTQAARVVPEAGAQQLRTVA